MGNNLCCTKDDKKEVKVEFFTPAMSENSIDEIDFRTQALSGDLILFKSRHFMSQMQRKITSAEYDHVGLVVRIKSDPSEVYFLEAVSTGVRLNIWGQIRDSIQQHRRDDDTFYEEAAFRHINFARNHKFQQKLQEFMHETLGKGYELNSIKLLRQKTLTMSPVISDRESFQGS